MKGTSWFFDWIDLNPLTFQPATSTFYLLIFPAPNFQRWVVGECLGTEV